MLNRKENWSGKRGFLPWGSNGEETKVHNFCRNCFTDRQAYEYSSWH